MRGATTIYLVRHGDRFDYANIEQWAANAALLEVEARDPPLSGLGFEQARAAAGVLAPLGITHILSSPYLRALQTAQQLAHVTGLSILVEDGLSEAGHFPKSIDCARLRYPPTRTSMKKIPRIDINLRTELDHPYLLHTL